MKRSLDNSVFGLLLTRGDNIEMKVHGKTKISSCKRYYDNDIEQPHSVAAQHINAFTTKNNNLFLQWDENHQKLVGFLSFLND